jgi:hypothetical protein
MASPVTSTVCTAVQHNTFCSGRPSYGLASSLTEFIVDGLSDFYAYNARDEGLRKGKEISV